MSEFEYKLFPLPRQLDDGGTIVSDKAAFAPTLQRQINLIAAAGWEFVGREEVPCERRSWLVLRRKGHEDFLVFRRPLGPQRPADGAALAAAVAAEPGNHVRPRRISAAGLARAHEGAAAQPAEPLRLYPAP